MPMLPKISIITVSLNAEKTLERAIHSLINQHYPHAEYIVIDGGSTDSTPHIIKKHEDHIHYWQSQPDSGASQALNIGISRSTGELIGFLFADDWLEPETLSKVGLAYQQNPDSDMITCQSRIVKKNKNQMGYDVVRIYQTHRALAVNLDNMLFNQPLIANRFIKKQLFEKIGDFIETGNDNSDFLSNDREFLIRAALHNTKNTLINHMGYNYFQHEGSRTLHQSMKTKIQICKEHIDIATHYLTSETLSPQQQKLFKGWESIKYALNCLYQIKLHAYKEAARNIKKIGFNKSVFILYQLAKKIFLKQISACFKKNKKIPHY